MIDPPRPPRRECSGCTLCCKLLPIPALQKAAGERCKHQRHGKGCAIYSRRPAPCAGWFCRWLINDDMADFRRPDRSHYVVDVVPDYVTLRSNETGEAYKIAAVQIWCDPDYRTAHRDPVLRAWLARHNTPERPVVAVVRYGSREGFVLIPPGLFADEWIEHESGIVDTEHTLDEAAMVWKGEA